MNLPIKKRCFRFLNEKYEEKIKLTQFEYDLLRIYCDDYHVPLHCFIVDMQKIGYFKNVDL